MRKGFDGLSVLVQETLKEDPFSGQCFVFRNRRGNRLKLLLWDGSGFVLIYKRLDQGTFYWPPAIGGKVRVSHAELSLVFDGMDWRRLPLNKTNKPTLAA
jgi:transposase